jgi:isoleucyl-tRNA synthetase
MVDEPGRRHERVVGRGNDVVIATRQQARREADLDISDRIIVTLSVDDQLKAQIQPHVGLIAGETLAIEVLFDASGERTVAVEGALIGVTVAIPG